MATSHFEQLGSSTWSNTAVLAVRCSRGSLTAYGLGEQTDFFKDRIRIEENQRYTGKTERFGDELACRAELRGVSCYDLVNDIAKMSQFSSMKDAISFVKIEIDLEDSPLQNANAKAHLVLAHGARASMSSDWMNQLCQSLSSEGVKSYRFGFPYMQQMSATERVHLTARKFSINLARSAGPLKLDRFIGGKAWATGSLAISWSKPRHWDLSPLATLSRRRRAPGDRHQQMSLLDEPA